MVQSGRWIPVFRGDILLTSSRHAEDKGIMFFSETFVSKYQTIRCHNVEKAFIRTAIVSFLILTFILRVTCWSLKRNVCDGVLMGILQIILL